MCLILFAWRARAGLRLALAANRDEFHGRASAAAAFWDDHPEILAGRDLASGGTWLGATRGGRFAAVTNVRDFDAPVPGDAPTRGALASGFLAGRMSAEAWAAEVAARGAAYRGFNLLLADRDALWWCSNRGNGPRRLEPGVYGVSNHLLDTPWPKVARGKAQLEAALARGPGIGALFELVSDATPLEPDAADPRDRMISAARIVAPAYGTRCSTALAISEDGAIEFAERCWNAAGAVTGTRRYALPAPA